MTTLMECPHCRTDDIKHGATVCRGCGAEIVYENGNAQVATVAGVIVLAILWGLGALIDGMFGFILGAVGGVAAGIYFYKKMGPSENIKWNRRQNASRK